jgi:SAM-dependent methyltransferase
MTDWTAGYVADIDYTYGYYQELNPERVRLALLNADVVPPTIETACELGFGQGISVNVHAAASTSSWYGTDFNPAQANFARRLADTSGAPAMLYDDSFAEFAKRSDLPDFDYIGLHGIWSWISDENRAVIVDFIRRKLKVGGVLYISYNTLPGWSMFAPMRHLMTQHANLLGVQGDGIVKRIDGALEFADKLLAAQPGFVRANPRVPERFQKVREMNRHYLAHEYFNRDWHPMYFADMAKWLEPAKLDFACSAHPLDWVDAINYMPAEAALLNEVKDPLFKQSVRDFIVNQQFRREYWVRGALKLTTRDKSLALRDTGLVLTSPRENVAMKVTGPAGEVTLVEPVYKPILDILDNHQPIKFGEVEKLVQPLGVSSPQLMQAVCVLMGTGHLVPVQSQDKIAKAKPYTERFNAGLCQKAAGSNDVNWLASPVTGGAVPVARFSQLFLLSIKSGQKDPAQWAASVWATLAQQNQKLLKDGKALDTVEENLAELNKQAAEFAAKQLPILRALQII